MGERQDGTEPMTPEVAILVLQDKVSSWPMRREAIETLARLVDSHLDDAPNFGDAVDRDGVPRAWHFVGYRPQAAELGKHSTSTLNPPEAAQYQGVIFADGTVAMRWLTERRSTSTWDSFDDMFEVHGHPEYGTQIRWTGDAPEFALNVIAEAERAAQARDAELHRAMVDVDQELAGPDAVSRQAGGAAWDGLTELPQEAASPAEVTVQRDREARGVAEEADPSGNTLVVCLDCAGVPQYDRGETLPLIVPFTEKRDADSWLQVHRASKGHRVVTVPGWPSPGQAIATARQHVREVYASGGDQ